MNLIKSKEPLNLIIPAYSGFIVSLVLSVTVLMNIINYGSAYDKRITIAVLFLFICWTGLFALALIKNKQRNKVGVLSWIAITGILIIIAIRLATIVWGSGYLNLDIYKALLYNTMMNDSLWQAEVATTLGAFGTPARIINGITPYTYHIGSHIVMMLVSKITGVNQLFAYCYLYPTLVLPLLIASFFAAVMIIRSLFLGDNGSKATILDAILVLALFSGLLPQSWLSSLAIWPTSGVISETYAFAHTAVLLFIIFAAVSYKKGWLDNKVYSIMFCLLLCPVAVFCITFTKMSVGLLFCGGIVYFFFRSDIKSLFNWLSIILSGLAYLLATLLMNQGGVWGDSLFDWQLFAFANVYAQPDMTATHYLIYCAVTLLVLFLRFKEVNKFEKMIGKEFLFEQMLFFVCFFGILPGLLVNIGGGSAAYFSELQVSMSVLMLLSYDYPNKAVLWIKENTKAVGKIIAAFTAVLIFLSIISNIKIDTFSTYVYDRSHRGKEQGTAFPKSQFHRNPYIVLFDEVDREVRNSRADYWILIEETSILWWMSQESPVWMLRQLMAYTGVVITNAIFYYNDNPYYRYGLEADDAWFYPFEQNRRDTFPRVYKKDLDEIIEDARANNIKYLVYLVDDIMEVIPIN